jgi:hypothetical protein
MTRAGASQMIDIRSTRLYAAHYPDAVPPTLSAMCCCPASLPCDDNVLIKRVSHLRFFDVRDLPEMLIAGQGAQVPHWFHNNEVIR